MGDRELFALTRLTAWHARRGLLKGTFSKFLRSGLSKLMKAKLLLARGDAHVDRETQVRMILKRCTAVRFIWEALLDLSHQLSHQVNGGPVGPDTSQKAFRVWQTRYLGTRNGIPKMNMSMGSEIGPTKNSWRRPRRRRATWREIKEVMYCRKNAHGEALLDLTHQFSHCRYVVGGRRGCDHHENQVNEGAVGPGTT